MNVLVTGGAGFVGSHACKELYQSGYTPVTYDNLVIGNEWAVKWGPFERGNLLETDRLIQVIRDYDITVVLHFAAFAYVGESINSPDIYYVNNVSGSLSLLRAMKETGVCRLVFSSTCATYGIPIELPIDEKHPQFPVNPYGFSKFTVERMIQDFGAAYGIKAVLLRYFNAAGADPELLIGESHDPETHLIPLAIAAALGKGPQLTVHGFDYPTSDGTCIRDFVHVNDLAAAHVAALKYMVNSSSNACSAFNLGTGRGFSVKEIINSVEKVTGRSVPYHLGPRRNGDPPVLVADSSRACKELNWKPCYEDIDIIITTAYNWFQHHTT
jgi:UDP-arabinose 4-epimerase